MKDCIVTTLKGSVNNPSLEKFGVMRIHLDESITMSAGEVSRFDVVLNEADTIKMINTTEGCHFTDSTGTQDLGFEVSAVANATTKLYITNGSCDIELPKYGKVKELQLSGTNFNMTDRFVMDIEMLKYSSISYLSFGSTPGVRAAKSVYGDFPILGIQDTILSIKLPKQIGVTGNVADILEKAANIKTLLLDDTGMYLDLSKLISLGHNIESFTIPRNIHNADIKYFGYTKVVFIDITINERPLFYGSMEELASVRASISGAGYIGIYRPGYFNVTYQGTPLNELYGTSVVSKYFIFDASGNITSVQDSAPVL